MARVMALAAALLVSASAKVSCPLAKMCSSGTLEKTLTPFGKKCVKSDGTTEVEDGNGVENVKENILFCKAAGGEEIVDGDSCESMEKMGKDTNMCKYLSEDLLTMVRALCCKGATLKRPVCDGGKVLDPAAVYKYKCVDSKGKEVEGDEAAASDEQCSAKNGTMRIGEKCGMLQGYVQQASLVSDSDWKMYKPSVVPKCCVDAPPPEAKGPSTTDAAVARGVGALALLANLLLVAP